MPLYLGLDSSTQSLSAIVIEVDAGVRHGNDDALALARLLRFRDPESGKVPFAVPDAVGG